MLQLPPLACISIFLVRTEMSRIVISIRALKQNVPKPDYVAALLADLDADLAYVPKPPTAEYFLLAVARRVCFPLNAIKIAARCGGAFPVCQH